MPGSKPSVVRLSGQQAVSQGSIEHSTFPHTFLLSIGLSSQTAQPYKHQKTYRENLHELVDLWPAFPQRLHPCQGGRIL